MPKPRSRARPRLGYGNSGELAGVETTGSVVFVIGVRPALRPDSPAVRPDRPALRPG